MVSRVILVFSPFLMGIPVRDTSLEGVGLVVLSWLSVFLGVLDFVPRVGFWRHWIFPFDRLEIYLVLRKWRVIHLEE